ncbi:MAG: zinc carboxypeptidase [Candidatus Schekmanbacteria bacterium]|nr:zinc carboxypeptidase [Candidatus Schekmanbacteria bacterium]
MTSRRLLHLTPFFFSASVLIATCALLAGPASAANPRAVELVRVHAPGPTLAAELARDPAIDVAGYSPGRLLDLIVTADQLRGLLGRFAGYRTSVLTAQVEAEIARRERERGLGRYHSYDEIVAQLSTFATQYAAIAQLSIIGESVEGRDIYVLKISDNAASDEPTEANVLIDGLHHARELIAAEVPLYIAEQLLSGYAQDARITNIVNTRQIWVAPVVNPDGYIYAQTQDSWWRKNRKGNYDGSRGVDLNRNYDGAQSGDPAGDWGGEGSSHVPWTETYCGTEAFSEPESQAVRDLLKSHPMSGYLTYHSYGELVLWPWGYTAGPTPDDARYKAVGTELARRIPSLSGGTYEPLQGYDLYPTTGTSDDWGYGGAGALSFTIELGQEFAPSATKIDQICADNLDAALYLAEVATSTVAMK